MQTLTTRGIKISVETFYQEEHSRPGKPEFVYAYRITIENKTKSPVRLLRRHWYIWDTRSNTREVEGAGVLGKQPVIEPDEMHQYISWSSVHSTIGKMYGTFTMKNLSDHSVFKVVIPVFQLIPPFQDN